MIPVVQGDLSPDQLITSANWMWGAVPEKKITRFMIREPAEMKGMVSRYYKKNGEPFFRGDYSLPDIIHNQDKVTLTVLSGLIRISIPGIALKNGGLGCTIRVLNPATQKILDAVIIDSRNVEVRFN